MSLETNLVTALPLPLFPGDFFSGKAGDGFLLAAGLEMVG